MAESLFGPSVADIQAKLRAEEEARAFKLAQLNPYEQVGFESRRSAGMFGDELARVGNERFKEYLPEGMQFGPQEDPLIAEARKMAQVKKTLAESGADPSKIDEYFPAMIEELQKAGMIEQAVKMEEQYARIMTQREGIQQKRDAADLRRRQNELPGLKTADAMMKVPDKYNPAVVAEFADSVTKENPRGDASILARAPVDKAGSTKYSLGGSEVGTGLPVLIPNDGSEPFVWDEGKKRPAKGMRQGGNTTKVEITQAGDLKTFEKVEEMRKNFRIENKPLIDQLRNVNQAQSLYEQARAGNAKAQGALEQTFAGIFKTDSQMSAKELNRIISNASLPRGIMDKVSGLATGTPTNFSLDEMDKVMVLMRQVATAKKNKAKAAWVTQAKRRNIPEGDIDYIVMTDDVDDEEPRPYEKQDFGAPPPGAVRRR